MTFKEIIVWLFVFIVGSLIVSFLIYPQNFQSFKQNLEDLTENVADTTPLTVKNIIDTKPSSSPESQKVVSQESKLLTSCLTEIKEQTRIAEERAIVKLNIDIKEQKQFDNTISAVQYLRDWGLLQYRITGVNYYPDLFENNYGNMVYIDLSKEEDWQYIIEYDNLLVYLIRFDYSLDGQTVGVLKPILCVDGKLTSASKRRFFD